MAFNHVNNCDCPVGCCDCGPETIFMYGVEYYNFHYNEWVVMKFDSRQQAKRLVLENWEEIKKKRLVRKLARKPRLFKLT